MADLVITEAQVLPGENAELTTGQVGQAVNVGETLYFEEETQRYKLADANLSVQTARTKAIALGKALAANQFISMQTGGTIILGAGAAPVKGTIYVQSATAGKMAPASDLATGHNVTIAGIGDGANGLALVFLASDISV